MNGFVTYLDPQPDASEVPLRLTHPFGVVPHLLAQHAAFQLKQNLAGGTYFAADEFTGFQRGKMFGVLLVRDNDARIGFIKAFSGMAQDSWLVDGFAGPLFDLDARDAVWPAGQAELGLYTAQLEAIAAFVATMPNTGSRATRERALADRGELRERRAQRSNELLEHMRSGYRIPNARNETVTLREIFAPHAPPGGAGDCAAPKLFAFAQKHHLQPLALAEFWWGTTPTAGGRIPGTFYPACLNKCGPILQHMLKGWDVDEMRL